MPMPRGFRFGKCPWCLKNGVTEAESEDNKPFWICRYCKRWKWGTFWPKKPEGSGNPYANITDNDE